MSTEAVLTFGAAILGGALRVGVPFLFVSLGECLTEKSGRVNLGLEGVLVLSAMAGFGGAYLSNSVWLGVLLAAVALFAFGSGVMKDISFTFIVGILIAVIGGITAWFMPRGWRPSLTNRDQPAAV